MIIRIALFLALFVMALFWLDRPLALALHRFAPWLNEPAAALTLFLDTIFANTLYVWPCLGVVGLGLLLWTKNKKYGLVCLATIVINVSAYYTTSTLKNLTDRSRPNYYMKHPNTSDFFNKEINGDSFPSGHASFYWSLFLPFALVFRRYAAVLLIVPALISVSRMAQSFHYLSDVMASFAIAWVMTVIALAVLDNIANRKLIAYKKP